MAWAKLGSNTLTVTTDPITLDSFTGTKFNVVLSHDIPTTTRIQPALRPNNDTGSNYSFRYSGNGGTDTTATAQNHLRWGAGTAVNQEFVIGYMINIATEEKLSISFCNYSTATGAGTAPSRQENVGKWVNTSDLITSYSDKNGDTGDYGGYASDSNLTALGSDGVESLNVQDGAVYYETDTNKSYILYNSTWSEL